MANRDIQHLYNVALSGWFFLMLFVILVEVSRIHLIPSFLLYLEYSLVTVLVLDLLSLALMLGALCLVGRLVPSARLRRYLPILVLMVLAVFYLLVIVSQIYLTKTGTMVDLDLVAYAVMNLGDLRDVLASELDLLALFYFFVAEVFFMLGLRAAGKHQRIYRLRWPVRATLLVSLAYLGMQQLAYSGHVSAPYGGVIVSSIYSAPPRMTAVVDELKASTQVEMYRPPSIVEPRSRLPNIIVIVMESTRSDTFEKVLNFDAANTPLLKQVVSEGLSFTHAYTSVSHTSKALTAMFCGMYPHPAMEIREAREGQLPLTCLPKLLASIGYQSAFVQSALGSFENRIQLLENMGFGFVVTKDDLDHERYAEVGYLGLDDMAMIEPASRWITEVEGPFFATVLTVGTHHPYETPAASQAEPDQAGGGFVHPYDQAVLHGNRFIDTLLRELDGAGKLDNTLLMVIGDHGEAFGEHNRYQHDVVPFEEVTRTPLVLWSRQAVVPAGVDRHLRQHIDIVPTILDLVSRQWVGVLPGLNLLESDGHPTTYTACWYTLSCLSMRRGTMKYVYDIQRDRFSVFNLEDDPAERDDLAERLAPDVLQAQTLPLFTTRALIEKYYDAVN